jgi:hypothetical protein
MFTKQQEESQQDYFELFRHCSSFCASYSTAGMAQSVVTRLRAVNHGIFVWIPAGAVRDFLSSAELLAGSEYHPTFYSMGTEGYVLGFKETEICMWPHTTAPCWDQEWVELHLRMACTVTTLPQPQVEQQTAQNKTETRTSSARGVMEDRSRFGLLLLQRQFGKVVPILHKHKHQFSLNV